MSPITRSNRLRSQKGFTLIELLVVIIILGILLAIALPSYWSFKQKENDNAAKTRLTAAAPAIESYRIQNGNGGYIGMTYAAVHANDNNLKPFVVEKTATRTSYCISSQVGSSHVWYKAGPNAQPTTTPDDTGICGSHGKG